MTSISRRALRIVATVILFCLLVPSVQAAPCSLTAADIDAYLQGKNSPLAGTGAAFVEKGSEFNVDPRLIIAIAGAESSFGRSVCGTNNAWNWFWCYATKTGCGDSPCPNSPFESWDSGIHTVTKYMRLSYLNKGRNTIELIGQKYCTEGCQHWVPNVTTFYATELGGDVRDLGCAPECTGATCATFVPCATPGADCEDPVCAKIAGVASGQCVEGTTPCAGLADCVSSSDCAAGGICAVQSCCGRNVCVPTSAFCSSTSGAQRLARPKTVCGGETTIGSCKIF